MQDTQCPKCGYELYPWDKECPKCRTPLEPANKGVDAAPQTMPPAASGEPADRTGGGEDTGSSAVQGPPEIVARQVAQPDLEEIASPQGPTAPSPSSDAGSAQSVHPSQLSAALPKRPPSFFSSGLGSAPPAVFRIESKWHLLAAILIPLVLIGSCFAQRFRLPLPDILTGSVGQVLRADNIEVVVDAVRVHPVLDSADPKVVAEVRLTAYNRRGGAVSIGASNVTFGNRGPDGFWFMSADSLGLDASERWNDTTVVDPGERRSGYVLVDARAGSPFASADVVIKSYDMSSRLTVRTPPEAVASAAEQLRRLDQQKEAEKRRTQAAVQPPSPSPTTTTGTPYGVPVGQEGILDIGADASTIITVAPSIQAFDALITAARHNDALGMMELELAGEIFCPFQGTRVLVIDRGGFLFSRTQVRILEGEFIGRSGWVCSEFVRRK